MIEQLETNRIKYSSSILLLGSSIQRYTKNLEKLGMVFFPIKPYSNNTAGEDFRFCFKSTVKFLFRTYKILDAACTRLFDISSSIDGATLIRLLKILASGVKLIDVAIVDLISSHYVNIPSAGYSCLVQI